MKILQILISQKKKIRIPRNKKYLKVLFDTVSFLYQKRLPVLLCNKMQNKSKSKIRKGKKETHHYIIMKIRSLNRKNNENLIFLFLCVIFLLELFVQ